MEIKLLPESVRGDLRSGITIRSISHCIIQLVLNSLDAKSTSIAIRVNLITSNIQIIDNGVGISRTNLKLLGFRYATSKYLTAKQLENNQYIFGFRGEALSSVINLTKIVTITSKNSATSKTYSKVFESGKTPKITSANQRPSIGTTILLEDVMYNMPVRKNQLKHLNCLNEIQSEIESIAIIHPHTSFSVRNDASGAIVFQTYQTKYVYQTAAVLYGKEFSKSLRKINYVENHFCLNGLIRIEPTQNKTQFIYVNKRLIKKSNINNCINDILNKSLIINSTEPTKFKYISYILNIKCPKNQYDLLDYTDVVIEFKNWDRLFKFIEVGVTNFLKKHKLLKSPKPIKGFDLLIGSPALIDDYTFRDSQVRGMIKGLPMKRKLETNSSSSKIIKLNLETPKNDLNILNKNSSQMEETKDTIETPINGKDKIMDIFLKSTAVYRTEIDSEMSFETATKYTNRSVCILTGNEDTDRINYSFSAKCLMNKTPLNNNNNKLEEMNKCKTKIVDNIQRPNPQKFKLKISQIKTVAKPQLNNKLIKNKQTFKTRRNFKLSSSENTFSRTHSFKYNNYKCTIKKRVTRKYVHTSDFIKPMLKPGKNKKPNLVINRGNFMLKSWYDYRDKSKSIEVINNKKVDLFGENTNRYFNYQNITLVPNEQFRLFNKPNLNLYDLINSNRIFHDDDDTFKMLPHSKINVNNSFDQTDLNLSLLPQSPLENNYKFPKVNYNITFDNITNFQTNLNNPNRFNITLNDLTMNDKKSLSNNIDFIDDLLNKQRVIDKSSIIMPLSTDKSNLSFENSYNSQAKKFHTIFAQDNFIPYQTNPNLVTNITKKVDKPPNYLIYDTSLDLSNCNRFYVNTLNNTETKETLNLCNTDLINENSLKVTNPLKVSNPLKVTNLKISNPLQVSSLQEESNTSNTNITFTPKSTHLDKTSATNSRNKQQKPLNSKDILDSYTNITFNNKTPKRKLNGELTPNLNITDLNHKTTKNPLNNITNTGRRIRNNTNIFKYKIQKNEINQDKLNNSRDELLNTYDSHVNLRTGVYNKYLLPASINSCLTKNSDDLFISTSTKTINKHISIGNVSQNSLILSNINQRSIVGNESNSLSNDLDKNHNLESQIINTTNSSNISHTGNEIINETFTNSNKNQDELENNYVNTYNSENENSIIKEINNMWISNKKETEINSIKSAINTPKMYSLSPINPKIYSSSPINPDNQTEWSKNTTLSGNLFYLNSRTGMSSFISPKNPKTYPISKRYSFMPKGTSQNLIPKSTNTFKSLSPNSKQNLYDTITNSDDYLKKIKWMNYFKTKDSESFFNHLYSNKKYFETSIPNISSTKVAKQAVNALNNFSFTKQSIDTITIIGQWDSKFILVKIFIDANTEILACFDQHAVHERIRLEQLLQDYYEIKNKLKSIDCNVPISLKIGDSDMRMLLNYRVNFENWGIFYEVTNDSVRFIKIPKCWQSKDNIVDNSCLQTLLELLIQEEGNWLRNVGHMHTALPLIILNDIKMEACRGAIKFGDVLTIEQCSDYIKKLATCDLPFQCAHGRPTLVPIFNLKDTPN